MRIKELFEDADIIDFRSGIHNLKSKNTRTTDPATYRKNKDIQARAAAKAEDIELQNQKKIDHIEKDIDSLYLKNMLHSYINTALWSSPDIHSDNYLDTLFDESSISADTVEKFLNICKTFVDKAGEMLDNVGADEAGHNLWLTQNRHGAGWWDGDYSEDVQEKLTIISHQFPEINLYTGDDGLLHA